LNLTAGLDEKMDPVSAARQPGLSTQEESDGLMDQALLIP